MLRENVLYSLVLAALMSLFMSGVIIVASTGMDNEVIQRWIHAFYIAFPMAFIALLILKPIACLITRSLISVCCFIGKVCKECKYSRY